MVEGYYSDIDTLPLQAWIECNKGNLKAARLPVSEAPGLVRYLRKAGKMNAANDKRAWENLYDDFLRKVGLGEDFDELVRLLKERAELQIAYHESKQPDGRRLRRMVNEIEGLSAQIKALIDSRAATPVTSVTKNLDIISKFRKYHISISQLTTLAYFEMIKDFNNGGK